MEWSGCHWLRHAISISDWLSTENSCHQNKAIDFVFDSEQMQRHYVVFDQAEKRDIKVLLTNWHLGTRRLRSGKAKVNGWIRNHPKDEDRFAEALAALVYHLKREKKYHCIWALSLWNEPNDRASYTGLEANYPHTFWPLYQVVDSQLRRLEVRDEILLLGPDTSTGGQPQHIAKMLEKHGPILDIVADHDYAAFRGKAMFRSIAAYTHLMHKLEKIYDRRVPFVISEFGNYGWGPGSVDDDKEVYSGTLSTIEYLIRMINQGVAGLARWEFLIYGNEWRNFGALTSRDLTYLFRPYGPVFYPHAITARYVKPGWEVRQVQVEKDSHALWVTALTSEKGDITILLLNDSIKPISLHLTFDVQPSGGQLHRLMVRGSIPEGIMQCEGIPLGKRVVDIELPPKSITALTSLPPGDLSLPEKLALKRTRRDLFHRLLNNQVNWMRRRTDHVVRYLRRR